MYRLIILKLKCFFSLFYCFFLFLLLNGFYTTIFSHFLNEDMQHYGRQLTLTHLDLSHFNFGEFMSGTLPL